MLSVASPLNNQRVSWVAAVQWVTFEHIRSFQEPQDDEDGERETCREIAEEDEIRHVLLSTPSGSGSRCM